MPASVVPTALLICTPCLAYGQTAEKPISFDAASIKPHSDAAENSIDPGGRTITSKGGGGGAPFRGGAIYFRPGMAASGRQGVAARKIILQAYSLTPYQLAGGPGWLDTDAFDVEAKAEGAHENQLRQMLRTLLSERFQLVVRRQTREMPVYALMVAKNGAKLREWKQGDPIPMPENRYPKNFRFAGTMQDFAGDLSSNASEVGRPVLDKTGLTGGYVLSFGWDEDYMRDTRAARVEIGIAEGRIGRVRHRAHQEAEPELSRCVAEPFTDASLFPKSNKKRYLIRFSI